MTRSSVYGLILLGLAGVLTGCTPECRVVQHAAAAGSGDTSFTVPAIGQDCEVHIYEMTARDSVGTKPR
jgi:hypothetical protein